MVLIWLFGVVYAVVTFLAPFYIMGVNSKLKETNEILKRLETRV